MSVVAVIAAAHIGAVELLAHALAALSEGDHIGPYLINVGAMGKVHHVRGKASRRAHVHFKAHIIALLAQALAVAVKLEELQVHEAACDTEGLDRTAAYFRQFCGNGFVYPVTGLQIAVDYVHHGCGEHAVVLKDGLSLVVENGVVGYQVAGYKLFKNKESVVGGVFCEPCVKLGGIVEFERA